MRLTSLALALLSAGALYYWFAVRGPARDAAVTVVTAATTGAAAEQNPPVAVMVQQSEARRMVDQLVVRGRTVAIRNVSVPAETAGLVISQPLRKGATVKQDEVLCRLDPGARAAQLLEAEAGLAGARVEAEAATTLSRKGFASETTRVARQAQLEAAQARVDLVELDIARLVIRAPFDGLLETDTAEIGSRLGLGDTCATVIDLSSVKVSGYVSEREVDQIGLGHKATARLINGRIIEGTISFISRVSDPATRTYLVEVTLPNQDGRIRDGMTAELRIDLPAEVAHLIRQSALTLDDAGRLGVRLAVEGKARFVEIRIIRDEIDGVWVTGLPDRASVIVVGQEFVRDGRAIAPTILDRAASQ
ncbi:MAG: efflux RND transporter periplasmic adaptor subunit [Proteobacteria bacterium]|nr:efflux RND transporter periplasmic adaptor subunit [Pseudomonadota bacterium]